jgi:hypothetical protein
MEKSVKSRLFATVSAVVLATLAAPAPAQHHHGAHAPTAKKAPAKKKPAAKKPAPKKAPARKTSPAKKTPARKAPAPRLAPPEPVVDHSKMDHAAPPLAAEPVPAAPVDHSQMGHGTVVPDEHDGHAEMTGALGTYPMTRESSGTAWQPDASEHMGVTSKAGAWDLMAHGTLQLAYDHQSGRRGDDKAFVSGMLMGTARRPIGDGTLQFRASLSPDPLMGKRGYPLLLASGETANGVDRLIDRQHPHDFFMELSASLSQNIGPRSSAFLYAALPGEPAFGPPAFMHREAILDSPEAPITHHWLDSTHISFGVLTGGLVLDRVKVEISRFNGREPDQHRWNIETAPLDSTAVRLSWNPTAELALQGSWGRFINPEQLEPGVDQTRWSASALYAREIAPDWKLAATLAWGRKSIRDHHGDWLNDDALALEASLKHGPWTFFGRGEITENRELVELEGEEHGPAFRVGKISVGAVRDVRIAEHLSLGLGGLLAVNFVPDGLAPLYGSENPTGAMGFLRLKLD